VALSLLLAVSGLGIAGTSTALAAYTKACSGTNVPGSTYRSFLDQLGITTIDAVASVPYLRDTGICTGTNGQSWDLPVNLQESGNSGLCAVQVGWGRATGDTGLHWYKTQRDDNCALSETTTWPAPVVGHSYTLRIAQRQCGEPPLDWEYDMTDITTGVLHTWCGSRYSTGSANEIWSGYEVHDDSDQLGGAGTAQTIASIGHASCVGCSYTYLTNTTLHVIGTTESYWHTSTGHDPDGDSKIMGYTSSH
jgi:hypothetical protein